MPATKRLIPRLHSVVTAPPEYEERKGEVSGGQYGRGRVKTDWVFCQTSKFGESVWKRKGQRFVFSLRGCKEWIKRWSIEVVEGMYLYDVLPTLNTSCVVQFLRYNLCGRRFDPAAQSLDLERGRKKLKYEKKRKFKLEKRFSSNKSSYCSLRSVRRFKGKWKERN